MAERDEHGRFKKGVSGNPRGRPRRATEDQYLEVLAMECAPEDARTIIRTAVAHAKAGDGKAREWLFNYLLGRPVERHEVEALNLNVDLGALSDDQLERIAAGENPAHVLASASPGGAGAAATAADRTE